MHSLPVVWGFNGKEFFLATLQIAHKEQSTEVWDALPVDVKAAFKITEVNQSAISLQYKH